ncbi:hypothetical protein A3194_12765 [Candidatus Thiodiazotropha endoloripes]|uniref:hypothetical protein n=1 Tax=Candidatus Thiodiazotropha endoloripes TaxID=1818881 RepID=UPI00083D2011|nr:hypothetical protein [Candidatus Thiodiazotropha endoloripes]MCG7984631.1 hypothetical protein [Candidatus Thiodiazotropha lotti]ODB85697.1 hypothetical protein A3194_12765 [Candidatus Thiodiazotropha endoloripes]
MKSIIKDFWNHLLWGTIAIAAGIFSFIAAKEQPETTFVIILGCIFVAGGIFLIVSAWLRRHDFRGLIAEGKKYMAWISVHHSGAGKNSATSFIVKVYLSKTSINPSIVFETSEINSLQEVMEEIKKAEAILLKRERNTGLVIIYFKEQAILPSGKVRYFY